MKTKKICLFLLLSTFIGLNALKADCEEAKQEGENLLVSVEPATLKTEDTLLEIVLISDNIYIEVSENLGNNETMGIFDDFDVKSDSEKLKEVSDMLDIDEDKLKELIDPK